jgi:protein TonB
VTDLTKDIRFKYALIATLMFHSLVFYRPAVEKTIQRATLAVASSTKTLKLSFRKAPNKKVVTQKKKIKKVSKLARKKVQRPKEVIEQKIQKAQAAIMKTVLNSKALTSPTPRYPRRAQRRGLEGKVLVSIMIGVNGHAYDAKLIKSSGHKILDDAALKTAMEWKFQPAMLEGALIKSVNTQSFVFSLQNR